MTYCIYCQFHVKQNCSQTLTTCNMLGGKPPRQCCHTATAGELSFIMKCFTLNLQNKLVETH